MIHLKIVRLRRMVLFLLQYDYIHYTIVYFQRIKVANRMTDNDWNVKKILQSLILDILLIRIFRRGQARQVNRL